MAALKKIFFNLKILFFAYLANQLNKNYNQMKYLSQIISNMTGKDYKNLSLILILCLIFLSFLCITSTYLTVSSQHNLLSHNKRKF